RALARRQGLSDPALDRLLVSIPAPDLARAEERARFWPSELPDADAAPSPAADPASGGQTTLPAPTDASQAPPPAPPPAPGAIDAPAPDANQDP
ncbi:MAG TPA: hypothetical protein VL147_08690, partial [Devosia sp.]|nr:hypothetical protein [Devosia sp.]